MTQPLCLAVPGLPVAEAGVSLDLTIDIRPTWDATTFVWRGQNFVGLLSNVDEWQMKTADLHSVIDLYRSSMWTLWHTVLPSFAWFWFMATSSDTDQCFCSSHWVKNTVGMLGVSILNWLSLIKLAKPQASNTMWTLLIPRLKVSWSQQARLSFGVDSHLWPPPCSPLLPSMTYHLLR